ncbi:MAG: hypothetical protein WBA31_01665 [Candidatus Dormiibacterota bacterium]
MVWNLMRLAGDGALGAAVWSGSMLAASRSLLFATEITTSTHQKAMGEEH